MKLLLPLATTRRLPRSAGSKALRLAWLDARGFRVPRGYVCPWDVQARCGADPAGTRAALFADLTQLLQNEQPYAVRSSAEVEDGRGRSFAGQFKTVLDVAGAADVLAAVEAVWASAALAGPPLDCGPAASARGEAAPPDQRMAVIIQEMVAPVASGVAFSKNPLTGLDEIVIEAVAGRGDALVQGGVTPERWVHKWGAWRTQGHLAALPDAALAQIVAGVKAAARAFGAPVDMEWVYDGAAVHWVQLRPITALDDVPIYADHIARELLPGLIPPLIWSVNTPLVNGAWLRVFGELIGPNDIQPASLSKSFFYRAYFNMATVGRVFELIGMPRESLELMMGLEGGPEKPRFKPTPKTYLLMPRLLRFAAAKWRFGSQIAGHLPALREAFRAFEAAPLDGLDEAALFGEIDRLYALTQEAAYFNIVTPLLMQLYNAALRRQLARLGVDAERFDVTHDLPELAALTPDASLAQIHDLLAELSPAAQAAAQAGDLAALAVQPGAGPIQAALARLAADFGHLSENGNNFAVAPWRENPGLLLKMAANARIPAEPTGQAGRLTFADLRLGRLQRPWIGLIYRRARQFRLYREQISALYTLGYGLFRRYFLALGQRLVRRGLLVERADIFLLAWDEVRRAAAAGPDAGIYAALVAQRRAEMAAVTDIIPPPVIYGDQAAPVAPPDGRALRGIPAARGYYRGLARVIRSLDEFDRLGQGEVLVIPFCDVGWTPLFRKAGAVVAESGGLLSHSAIVAREACIPAVVSVEGACRLLDGLEVTVDGAGGEVIIHGGL